MHTTFSLSYNGTAGIAVQYTQPSNFSGVCDGVSNRKFVPTEYHTVVRFCKSILHFENPRHKPYGTIVRTHLLLKFRRFE